MTVNFSISIAQLDKLQLTTSFFFFAQLVQVNMQ